MSESLRELRQSSFLSGANAAYIEALYEEFLRDPAAVAAPWRELFAGLPAGVRPDRAHGPIRDRLVGLTPAAARAPVAPAAAPGVDPEKQAAVSRLIQIWANRGHLVADIDPLGLLPRPMPPVLDPANVGLTEADLDTDFFTGTRSSRIEKQMRLRDILAQLRRVYGGRIGAEFAHVSTTAERLWLQDQFQEGRLLYRFSKEEQVNLLRQLTAAEGLERYLHTKYVGQKRFSLEGGDALIPLLDDVVQRCGAAGVQEIIIGMAHRGRLNVLVNVLGKPPATLFSEFEGRVDLDGMRGSGDVKYHKGYSADLRTPGGDVHVALAFNPSHLEVVNAVVEGSVRARQERRGDRERRAVVPVLIHGDAAFAGQGVVMETLQLSQARGFTTGGTLHVVINNQVGFTTSDPRDARSTLYCSDVAKIIEAPIFHVNADDPEAVVFATRLALDYRMKFGKDAVIDLVCYRRHGHNEADEPAATQPAMYRVIRRHPTARQIYGRKLEESELIAPGQAERMLEDYRNGLDGERPQARAFVGTAGNRYTVDWSRHLAADWSEQPLTGVPPGQLAELGARLTSVPEGFVLQPRVARIIADRGRMYAGELPLDWGAAEMLGYAALLAEGCHVRLTGQDSGRGTFFHRHAVLHDQDSERQHVALAALAAGQGRFQVIDSVLSEEAVLGFEYGYATTDPDTLVIWEAQFGDFANGAQVIIDQFIAAGEAKWQRLCGLVLLLPHGFEGQGPEHSSARLERFLQLAAEQNLQVCVPSTPAQMFHLLRRQMRRALRKPLVVMTPKSLLRHRLATSTLAELAGGSFAELLDDPRAGDPAQVRRLVLCSGKVYYDLLERRQRDAPSGVAIARLEQLYPFPEQAWAALLARYPRALDVVWCQEEPQNQGAWYQIRHWLQAPLGAQQVLLYAGRASAAAPATGVPALHEAQQAALVQAALESSRIEESHRATHRLTVAAHRKNP